MDLSIVIITKNRPIELNRLITNISEQKLNYSCEIIIIDSSNTDIFYQNDSIQNNKIGINHISSTISNKAFQRNLGVKNSSAQTILFLDDDVILKENYINNIMDIISINKYIFGLTGFVQNQKEYSSFEKHFRWFFMLQDVNGKKTIRKLSGYFSFNNFPSKLSETSCLWGCNMAIRKVVFNKIRFNEKLNFFDDIDFSIKILKEERNIYITNSAEIIHYRTSNERTKAWKTIINQSISMLRIIIGNREYYRLLFYLWSSIGIVFLILFSLLTMKDITKGTYMEIDYEN